MNIEGLTTGEVVRGQSDTDYHADTDHVSSTAIKAGFASHSPAAVWEAMTVGTSINASAAAVGRAVHAALLEPDTFQARFAVGPTKTRGTKAWASEDAESSATLLTAKEMESVTAMVDAARAHNAARSHIDAATDRELSCYAVEDGIKVKARLDAYCDADGYISDVKTTSSGVDAPSFAKAAERYAYHVQAPHYMTVARLCGLYVAGFRFIVIGKSYPHRVAVYTLAKSDIQLGMDIREAVLSDYRVWLEQTEGADRRGWMRENGYGASVLTLPAYAGRKLDQYLERT